MSTLITDPTQLAALGQLAMAQNDNSALPERPTLPEAPDTQVELPGGYLKFGEFEPVKTAEVRELNGFDEEKLGKISRNQPGKMLAKILELGTVAIGEERATPSLLDDLLVGDREALLLGIRIATYGRTLDFTLDCPFCNETSEEVKLDLRENIPMSQLEDEDREFDVEIGRGTASVRLPTGTDLKRLLAAEGKSTPELNTILLASCVTTINGLPIGTDAIRGLSIPDRQKLIEEIQKRKVGPQFEDVSLPCPSCLEKVDISVSLADLFRM